MIPIGDFARADFAVMRQAQELQGLVMDYIQDAYFAEEDLNLNNLTYARFMREYENAKAGGPLAMEELNTQLAGLLGPIIQQVMSQPPEAQ